MLSEFCIGFGQIQVVDENAVPIRMRPFGSSGESDRKENYGSDRIGESEFSDPCRALAASVPERFRQPHGGRRVFSIELKRSNVCLFVFVNALVRIIYIPSYYEFRPGAK